MIFTDIKGQATMRRLFIIRKDLHLSPGKLAAMVGHAAEGYWLELLKAYHKGVSSAKYDHQVCNVLIHEDIWDNYINGITKKTICECRNLAQLYKARDIAEELGLRENNGYGFINDVCLTEIKPENPDGTCTVGMWFKPLEDELAHKISKKFQLYRA